MAEFFGKMSIFGMNTRIIPEQEKSSQLLCELSSKNSDTRSKSNSFSGNRVSPAPLSEERTRSKSDSFSGNRVSPAPLPEEEDKYYIENTETLPCTPIPDEYDTWLEIDHTSEHNYTSHIRMMYKQVLDDLYRRFVPSNIHEKYLEEIRSPSWETFEKKHKI